jgi:hypothetical protein
MATPIKGALLEPLDDEPPANREPATSRTRRTTANFFTKYLQKKFVFLQPYGC